MSRFRPALEVCESRVLPTLVFVFNGNAFAASEPGALTQSAAHFLVQRGETPVQLATPPMGDEASFDELASRVASLARGQPVGLVGFSAGGALALRLSQLPQLNVTAVLDFYGPPDLEDWLTYHQGDRYYKYVTTRVHFSSEFIALMSGVSDSRAFIVSAFGTDDHNVVSSVSTVSFERDFPHGDVFTYPGPHGASLRASLPAADDFLEHLPSR
jgi:hypothetical protein